MLTRGEDYAHQQPSLTAQKLRRLEITAGAPVRKDNPSGVWVTHQKMRQAEKRARRTRPRPPTSGWSATGKAASPTKQEPVGASVTPEHA